MSADIMYKRSNSNYRKLKHVYLLNTHVWSTRLALLKNIFNYLYMYVGFFFNFLRTNEEFWIISLDFQNTYLWYILYLLRLITLHTVLFCTCINQCLWLNDWCLLHYRRCFGGYSPCSCSLLYMLLHSPYTSGVSGTMV